MVKRWVDMAMRIEGTNKTFGVHAAGVVIAADPLDELVPLQRNNDGQVITQYFMEDVESMGLLKMDFLGLKNLTMIEKTLELVEVSSGTRVDPDKLPPEDADTFALLARGDLEGIFQLNPAGCGRSCGISSLRRWKIFHRSWRCIARVPSMPG